MKHASIRTSILVLLAAFVGLSAVGCAAKIPLRSNDGTDLLARDSVQTLTNLHPDEARAKLYTVNYQQSGLIPMCTDVKLNTLTTKRLTFTVIDTNKTYTYDYNDGTVDPMGTYLKDYFGPRCNQQAVEKLDELDQRGIRQGRVLKGMTKDGVIYALGYPPKRATPSLDGSRWKYWRNRLGTMVVFFDRDDKVVRIEKTAVDVGRYGRFNRTTQHAQ